MNIFFPIGCCDDSICFNINPNYNLFLFEVFLIQVGTLPKRFTYHLNFIDFIFFIILTMHKIQFSIIVDIVINLFRLFYKPVVSFLKWILHKHIFMLTFNVSRIILEPGEDKTNRLVTDNWQLTTFLIKLLYKFWVCRDREPVSLATLKQWVCFMDFITWWLNSKDIQTYRWWQTQYIIIINTMKNEKLAKISNGYNLRTNPSCFCWTIKLILKNVHIGSS